jgi:hypothetical protein
MGWTTLCLHASNATEGEAPTTRQPNNVHVKPPGQEQSQSHRRSDENPNAIKIFWINISD